MRPVPRPSFFCTHDHSAGPHMNPDNHTAALADMQRRGMQNALAFGRATTGMFERLARQNYAVMGDVVDYTLTQMRIPTVHTDPRSALEAQAAGTRAAVEKARVRAAEYAAIAGELRAGVGNAAGTATGAATNTATNTAAAARKAAEPTAPETDGGDRRLTRRPTSRSTRRRPPAARRSSCPATRRRPSRARPRRPARRQPSPPARRPRSPRANPPRRPPPRPRARSPQRPPARPPRR